MSWNNLSRTRSRPRRKSWKARFSELARRILGTILGLVLFLALGVATVFLLRGENWLSSLIPALVSAFIALFGLNLALQSMLGLSDQRGFFYAALDKGRRLHPAVLTLGIPAILILSLLVSWAGGSSTGIDSSIYGLVVYGVWLAHLGLHELGHFLAAQGVGLVPIQVLVGPLEWTRAGRRWETRLNPSWFSILGGHVQVYSPSGQISALQMLRFALGGPLVTAILTAALLYWTPYSFHEMSKLPPGALGALFAPGLYLGTATLILNLIPSRHGPGGQPTDGYQIRSALQALRGE